MNKAMLEKLKKNPAAYVIWLVLSCAIHIVLFGAKVSRDYQLWERIAALVLAVCITLPLHELLHFAFMKLFGKSAEVRISVMKSPWGLPTLATVAQATFTKWQYAIIYLAPFVGLTLLIDAALIFCAQVELIFLVVPLCNCAGCFYDIVDTLIAIVEKN